MTTSGKSIVELLRPYVPTDRLHALAAGRDVPATRGAVLFADISGFTPLTERLVRELGARRGGEELTRHLNVVYGALLDEIERYGGSVVGFSGDAVTCWFGDDDGARALACGLRLHAVVPVALAIALKVSIAVGRVRRFVVGAPHVIDVMCGALLDRVAHGERLAERGDVVIDGELARALGDRVTIARRLGDGAFAVATALADPPAPCGWPALDPAALDDAALRPWLLPPVYERLRAGAAGDYLAELRQAVALFVRFDGLDYDRDPEVGGKLDAFVRWVQAILERHGGALLQLTTGDKGSYLYAVFGAPIAHEDDSARALDAALALRAPPPDAFVRDVRIGIGRGQLRAGAYGSERRRTYGVLGDETNVAARLMMRAMPGQVLVAERVVKSAGVRYQLGSLGELALKGKQERVPVYELVGRATMQRRAHGRDVLIGRDAERARIGDVVGRVAAGEHGVSLVIEGEPGMGKSSLVGELLDRARKLPACTCAIAAGVAIESGVPYHGWRRVIETLFGIDDARDVARAREQIAARMPAALAPLAPLLDAVVPLGLPDTAATADLHGGVRVAQTRRLLVRLVDALSGPGPIVLVFEDAHLLDSASWQVVEAVREQLGRVLLVLAVRPTAAPSPALAAIAARPATHVVRLAGLPQAELVAVVARRLGVADVPGDVAALVARVAEGNPFFAQELASALVETGVIEVVGGACRIARALDALPFPDTIEGVVTSRIDRLPPNERLALKVASVVGRAFQIAPLRDVFPVPAARADVPQLVAALSQAELATEVDAARETYVFKHAITQDVAYNLMLFEQRRVLHERLADWFDAAPALDPAAYALRAYHRLKSLDGVERPSGDAIRRAVDAVLQAGQRATASGASREAIDYFGHARALLARLPASRERSTAELELCTWLGTALAVAEGPTHERTLAELARARELSDQLGERSRLFEALFNQWYAHHTGSDRVAALEFSQRLIDLAAGHDADDAAHAMALLADHARGATLISIGRYAEGAARMRSGLAIARRSSRDSFGSLASVRNPALACHAYLAWASWFMGQPDQAIAEVEQAIAIANGAPHPSNLLQAHCFASIAHRYRREPELAEQHATRALAIATEHAIPYWMVVATAMRGWCAIQRGDVAAGVAMLDDIARRDREAGAFPLVWIMVRVDLVEGLAALGRFDDALAVADEAKRHAPARLLEFGLPEVHRVEGELHRARGDTARAAACFDRAIALAREHGARSLELRALLAYARLDPARRPELARVYATFSEGLHTPDLVEARALLAIETPDFAGACDFPGARDYVFGRLSRELAPELTYHCLEHTRDDVLPASLELAARHGVSADDTVLLATAALFHDLGFIECRDGHERVGVRVARDVLPRFGYTPAQIDIIAAIIMATKLPQTPRTLLEQLMADADLDVLGRDDFFDKNDALRQEWASSGIATTRSTWYAEQLAFLRAHRYFTKAAHDGRDAGKQRNIAELERRLEQAKAGTT